MQGRANARRSASEAAPLRCGASAAGLGRAGVPGKKAPFFLVDAERKAFWDGEARPFSCRRTDSRQYLRSGDSGQAVCRKFAAHLVYSTFGVENTENNEEFLDN